MGAHPFFGLRSARGTSCNLSENARSAARVPSAVAFWDREARQSGKSAVRAEWTATFRIRTIHYSCDPRTKRKASSRVRHPVPTRPGVSKRTLRNLGCRWQIRQTVLNGLLKRLLAPTLTRMRMLPNPLGLSSAGRNVGARHSSGELVFFIDGHCHIPTRTLLRDAVALFNKTGADCLSRPQPLTAEGNSFFQNVVAHVRATALGHGRDSTIYNTDYEGPVDPCSAGALYRRRCLSASGTTTKALMRARTWSLTTAC